MMIVQLTIDSKLTLEAVWTWRMFFTRAFHACGPA